MPDDKLGDSAASKPASSPKKVLAKASESGLPTVQQLIAERATAVMNGDNAKAKAIDQELADLGFE